MSDPNHDHIQMLYNVIAILTKKLGGSVDLTREEIQNPPVAIYTKHDNRPDGVAVSLKIDEEAK